MAEYFQETICEATIGSKDLNSVSDLRCPFCNFISILWYVMQSWKKNSNKKVKHTHVYLDTFHKGTFLVKDYLSSTN